MRHVRAGSVEELETLWDWLDDAEYSTENVRWDRDAHQVVVRLTNYAKDEPDFPQPKPDGSGLLSDFFLYPWFRATLTVHGARGVRPTPEELVEPGILEGVEWEDGRVRVNSIADTASFVVETDRFDVELAVTDEIDHWRRHSLGRYIRWEGVGARHPAP
jgi:hypothetical protein